MRVNSFTSPPPGTVPRQLMVPHVATDSASRTSDSYDPVAAGVADRRNTLPGFAVEMSSPPASCTIDVTCCAGARTSSVVSDGSPATR